MSYGEEKNRTKKIVLPFFLLPFSLPFVCVCVYLFVFGLGEFSSGSTSYSTSFQWQTFWLLGHTVQLENPRLRTYRGEKTGEVNTRDEERCVVCLFLSLFLFCFSLLPAP